ncbi:unnamed protein product [Protopolystoma xenopodis]|uniref:Uncharacterized protein n=1 Tax=Protopolystoma xenopodis TaxID=117903 RepID=A0A448X106_9PLAT|nr:unnamed protein product [Protopolystoma xenopodis]
MEVSSMSSDGTDLRISSPNISTRNGSNPNILLVEPTFESLHPTLSLGMERHRECSSKANRQLVKRNSPSSSGGTDKSSSKANRQLVKRNSPSSSGGTDLRISSPNTSTRNGIKPIDSWSRGIRRRLLVEPTFESSRQHESSSKTNRQLVKRNPPSSSGGTDLRISSTQHFYSKWK